MSNTIRLDLVVEGSHADDLARSLRDRLIQIDGVEEANATKTNDATMDLGTALQVILSSGVTVAIVNGISAWLLQRPNAKLIVEETDGAKSLKLALEGMNPAFIERVTLKRLRRG